MHWHSQEFVMRGPGNRGAIGDEFETTKAWRGNPMQPTIGDLAERRKLAYRVLVNFELEKKTNLVMMNLILFSFAGGLDPKPLLATPVVLCSDFTVWVCILPGGNWAIMLSRSSRNAATSDGT